MTGLFRQTWTALTCMCSAFRIQLYWQEGYFWQKQTHEYMEFCMMHSYEGYPGYGRCFYGATNDESGPCQKDAVYIAKCNNDRRQQWTFVELRNRQFQIKAVSSNKCMQKMSDDSRSIRMRNCNANESRQRFRHPANDEFSFIDDTTAKSNQAFILSHGASRECVGQLHHPKQGEIIELQNCRSALQSDTLYWEKD